MPNGSKRAVRVMGESAGLLVLRPGRNTDLVRARQQQPLIALQATGKCSVELECTRQPFQQHVQFIGRVVILAVQADLERLALGHVHLVQRSALAGTAPST